MIRLIKTTLHFHTFNKFFFIGAAMLLFLGLHNSLSGADSYSIVVMTQGIPITCMVVILNAENEKRSGGYRNKITAGYTIRQVFFSGIISAAACGAALFLVIGVPIYTSMGSLQTLLTVLMVFVFAAVVSACLAINLSNITFTILGLFLIITVCVVIADPVQSALDADKYNYRYVFDEAKAKQVGIREATTLERTPNAEYPTGIKRAALKAFAYANPYSQLLYLEDMLNKVEHEVSWKDIDDYEYNIHYIVSREYYFFPLISAALACAVSALSYLSYSKKDLR
ncbi:MAG: PrgI family protein [Ruminococcus sp.]|nr:PrgI family protein [Ruminococcus sp.]